MNGSFKKTCCITILLTSVNLITGCASLAQQRAIKAQCATSPILLTDLTQAVSNHKLMLPNGDLCSNEVA